MKAKRATVTVHIFVHYLGTLGGFRRVAYPASRITAVEDIVETISPNTPLAEAKARLRLGKDETVYVRETLEEVVAQLEGDEK